MQKVTGIPRAGRRDTHPELKSSGERKGSGTVGRSGGLDMRETTEQGGKPKDPGKPQNHRALERYGRLGGVELERPRGGRCGGERRGRDGGTRTKGDNGGGRGREDGVGKDDRGSSRKDGDGRQGGCDDEDGNGDGGGARNPPASQESRRRYVRHPKPKQSYVELIAEALQSAPSGALTLGGIARFLQERYAFFRGSYQGWRNSVRHNLSLHQCFRKILRDPRQPYGKDNLWTLDPRLLPRSSSHASGSSTSGRSQGRDQTLWTHDKEALPPVEVAKMSFAGRPEATLNYSPSGSAARLGWIRYLQYRTTALRWRTGLVPSPVHLPVENHYSRLGMAPPEEMLALPFGHQTLNTQRPGRVDERGLERWSTDQRHTPSLTVSSSGGLPGEHQQQATSPGGDQANASGILSSSGLANGSWQSTTPGLANGSWLTSPPWVTNVSRLTKEFWQTGRVGQTNESSLLSIPLQVPKERTEPKNPQLSTDRRNDDEKEDVRSENSMNDELVSRRENDSPRRGYLTPKGISANPASSLWRPAFEVFAPERPQTFEGGLSDQHNPKSGSPCPGSDRQFVHQLWFPRPLPTQVAQYPIPAHDTQSQSQIPEPHILPYRIPTISSPVMPTTVIPTPIPSFVEYLKPPEANDRSLSAMGSPLLFGCHGNGRYLQREGSFKPSTLSSEEHELGRDTTQPHRRFQESTCLSLTQKVCDGTVLYNNGSRESGTVPEADDLVNDVKVPASNGSFRSGDGSRGSETVLVSDIALRGGSIPVQRDGTVPCDSIGEDRTIPIRCNEGNGGAMGGGIVLGGCTVGFRTILGDETPGYRPMLGIEVEGNGEVPSKDGLKHRECDGEGRRTILCGALERGKNIEKVKVPCKQASDTCSENTEVVSGTLIGENTRVFVVGTRESRENLDDVIIHTCGSNRGTSWKCDKVGKIISGGKRSRDGSLISRVSTLTGGETPEEGYKVSSRVRADTAVVVCDYVANDALGEEDFTGDDTLWSKFPVSVDDKDDNIGDAIEPVMMTSEPGATKSVFVPVFDTPCTADHIAPEEEQSNMCKFGSEAPGRTLRPVAETGNLFFGNMMLKNPSVDASSAGELFLYSSGALQKRDTGSSAEGIGSLYSSPALHTQGGPGVAEDSKMAKSEPELNEVSAGTTLSLSKALVNRTCLPGSAAGRASLPCHSVSNTFEPASGREDLLLPVENTILLGKTSCNTTSGENSDQSFSDPEATASGNWLQESCLPNGRQVNLYDPSTRGEKLYPVYSGEGYLSSRNYGIRDIYSLCDGKGETNSPRRNTDSLRDGRGESNSPQRNTNSPGDGRGETNSRQRNTNSPGDGRGKTNSPRRNSNSPDDGGRQTNSPLKHTSSPGEGRGETNSSWGSPNSPRDRKVKTTPPWRDTHSPGDGRRKTISPMRNMISPSDGKGKTTPPWRDTNSPGDERRKTVSPMRNRISPNNGRRDMNSLNDDGGNMRPLDNGRGDNCSSNATGDGTYSLTERVNGSAKRLKTEISRREILSFGIDCILR